MVTEEPHLPVQTLPPPDPQTSPAVDESYICERTHPPPLPSDYSPLPPTVPLVRESWQAYLPSHELIFPYDEMGWV